MFIRRKINTDEKVPLLQKENHALGNRGIIEKNSDEIEKRVHETEFKIKELRKDQGKAFLLNRSLETELKDVRNHIKVISNNPESTWDVAWLTKYGLQPLIDQLND